MRTDFVLVDVEDNDSGALAALRGALGSRGVKYAQNASHVGKLLTSANVVGVVTDRRGLIDTVPGEIRVVFIDHRDPPDAEAIAGWLRHFTAYAVTRNATLAEAIAAVATRAGLTTKRTELMAQLIFTTALDEIATRAGISRNTAKAQLQSTMKRMREANPTHTFTTSADLLRAIIRELVDLA